MEAITGDKTIKSLVILSVVLTAASAVVNITQYLEEKERNRKSEINK